MTGTLPAGNGGTGVTALTSLNLNALGSGAATNTQVATANGAGAVAWVTPFKATDLASGTITARADDLNFSGGSDGDVWTVQADGSVAMETPVGGSSWDGDPADVDFTAGTDIAAALTDTDEIIVGDASASQASKTAALSRIVTLVQAAGASQRAYGYFEAAVPSGSASYTSGVYTALTNTHVPNENYDLESWLAVDGR